MMKYFLHKLFFTITEVKKDIKEKKKDELERAVLHVVGWPSVWSQAKVFKYLKKQ